MADTKMKIRAYSLEDETAVIELWLRCNLTKPQNNPKQDIGRKLKVNPELFLVGVIGSKVIASVMGGYDGHRGWVYYLGVEPAYQRNGFGRQMMEAVTEKLLAMGCPKVNLQVREDNRAVVGFYENIGYQVEDRVSMGKRLADN